MVPDDDDAPDHVSNTHGSRAARRGRRRVLGAVAGAVLAVPLAPAAASAAVVAPTAPRDTAVADDRAGDAPPWMRLVGELFGSGAAEEQGAAGRAAPGGFVWPLAGELSSGFGPRYGGMHTGLDIDADTGDPVGAAAPGRVVHTGPYFGYGETVMIDHGRGYWTLYGHLSRIDASVDEVVAAGDVVGRVGCTGACTGDHLHFEIRVRGEPRDPMPYLPRRGRPALTPLARATTLAFGPTA